MYKMGKKLLNILVLQTLVSVHNIVARHKTWYLFYSAGLSSAIGVIYSLFFTLLPTKKTSFTIKRWLFGIGAATCRQKFRQIMQYRELGRKSRLGSNTIPVLCFCVYGMVEK